MGGSRVVPHQSPTSITIREGPQGRYSSSTWRRGVRAAGGAAGLLVIESGSSSTNTIIPLEPSSFVSVCAPDPEFRISEAPLLHTETQTPTDVVVGSPTRSMFQVDAFALRMTLRASWGMRAPHVAVVNGVTW